MKMKFNKSTISSMGILFLACLICLTPLQAQTSEIDEIDPEAKLILDRINSKLDALESLKVDFDMEIYIPGQEVDLQKGTLKQKKDFFFFDISSQSIVANGEAVYVYLKEDNEIQINDPDFGDDGSLLSPAQMMRLYETEAFYYAITGVDGNISVVEFKPQDEFSDYSKLRIAIDTKKDEMQSLEIFSKDGSKIILKVNQITLNPNLSKSDFAFELSKYPNAYIEDLRID